MAYEEGRDQLLRNATGWGVEFEKMEDEGLLRVVCEYPESSGLEDHLIRIKSVIEEFNPQKLGVDSLSTLERISNETGFRESRSACSLSLNRRASPACSLRPHPPCSEGASVTEAHISTLTDAII